MNYFEINYGWIYLGNKANAANEETKNQNISHYRVYETVRFWYTKCPVWLAGESRLSVQAISPLFYPTIQALILFFTPLLVFPV